SIVRAPPISAPSAACRSIERITHGPIITAAAPSADAAPSKPNQRRQQRYAAAPGAAAAQAPMLSVTTQPAPGGSESDVGDESGFRFGDIIPAPSSASVTVQAVSQRRRD